MKNTLLLLTLITTSLSFQSCFLDNDDKLIQANEINHEDLIQRDSDLYNLMVKVTNNEGNAINNITCIEFIYSFLIFTYDENLVIIDETWVTNNLEFSLLLSNLPQNNFISLSYPIETTLTDGTPYTITTNDELIDAINSCAQDAMISYGSSLFMSQRCVWKVPFIDGADNTYAGGVFSVNNNTSVTFEFQNNTYTGTWIFFFINNDFNFNINLEGNSQAAQDWNINFNVAYSDNTLLLTSDTTNYFIKQTCEFMDDILVGQQTELGGIVAYDKEEYDSGWRYMEAHSADLPAEEWGCLSGDITFAAFEGIGDGWMSAVAIANYHLDLVDYQNNPSICNIDNNGTISALTALLLDQGTQGGNPDWFLPSIDELQKLYENLHLEGLGNFENDIYWSSTQYSESHAKALDFSTGDIIEIPKNTPDVKARAIRYF